MPATPGSVQVSVDMTETNRVLRLIYPVIAAHPICQLHQVLSGFVELVNEQHPGDMIVGFVYQNLLYLTLV
jgi:hypothetical protein